MEESRIPIDVLDELNPERDNANPERARWIKWMPSVLLAVLVPVLVLVAVFSRQPPSLWGAADIALFILTALLCTLVAVSLTLAGCSDWLRRMDHGSQTMVAQIVAVQDAQARLGEAVRKGNVEIGSRISQQEGQQRLAQDSVALLTGGVQTIASNMATLCEALQAQRQATTATLATLTGGHGQLTAGVQKLHALAETIGGAVADVAREQAAAHGTLQDSTGALAAATDLIQHSQQALRTEVGALAETARQTSGAVTEMAAGQTTLQDVTRHIVEELTGVATRQAALGDTLRGHEQASNAAFSTLTAHHGKLAGGLQQLRELTQAVGGAVAGAAQEQATAHGSLREALTATSESIQQNQRALQAETGSIAEIVRQTSGAVTAGQTALHDATQRITGELTGLAARQGALSDALGGHEQASNTAFSTLTASHAELAGGLQQLRELTQSVAGAIAGTAQDQAAAHGSLREALTAGTAALQDGQKTLQAQVEKVAEADRQALAGITTLTIGHGQLTNDLRQLQELTRSTAGGINDVAREQTVAHGTLQNRTQLIATATEALQQGQKTLQAQVEKVAETDGQMVAAVTALTAGHGQVSNDLRQLQELSRTVAGGLGEVAREQTVTRGTLQDSTQLLAAATEALQQGQKTLQAQVEKVTEMDRQMMAAVTTLTIGHGQLTNDVRQLQELNRTVAGGLSDVAHEQTVAHGTLQDRAGLIVAATEAVQRDQQALQAQIEKVAETARQTIAAVSAVAVEQTNGREAVRRMVGQAASAAIAALTAGQEQLTGTEPRLQVLAQTVASSGLLNAALSEPAAKASSPLRLAAAQAVIHGEQMKYEAGPGRDSLGYWANPSDWAQWQLDIPQPGRFTLVAEIAALAPGRFQVLIGDEELAATAPTTGDYGRFQAVELGAVELPAGKTSLAVRPIPESWQPMNLRSLDLTPVA